MSASAIAGLVLAATVVTSEAAACTLYPVELVKDAKLIVYFTRFKKEDATDGRYKDCTIVRTPQEDTLSFFVTSFRQDANTVVHKDNWP